MITKNKVKKLKQTKNLQWSMIRLKCFLSFLCLQPFRYDVNAPREFRKHISQLI